MKPSSIAVGLLFTLLTSVGFANQATLFRNSSGNGWSAFEQDLTKEGKLKNGVFLTAVLSQLAYDYAKGQKLPAGELEEKEFKSLFLLANNFGETITVSEFRQLGQSGQIVVPDLVARTAAVKTETPATPVAGAVVSGPTLPAMVDTKQAIAIANIEGQVKALQDEVKKAGGSQKEAAAVLANKLTAFEKQLQELNDGQGGFALKANLDAAKAELATLQGEVKALPQLRTDVTDLQTSVNTLKGNPILAWGSWLPAAIGALFVLSFIAIYLTRRESKAEVKEVKELATKVETKANEAMSKVTEATEVARSAKQEVQAVAAEVAHIKKVGGYSKVLLPDDFDAVLASLTKQGDSHTFCITVGDKPFLIEVESNGSGMVKVAGIKEVTKPVNPKNLEDIIYRAAKLDVDGNHRIVGVSADAHLKAA